MWPDFYSKLFNEFLDQLAKVDADHDAKNYCAIEDVSQFLCEMFHVEHQEPERQSTSAFAKSAAS